jgi:hypothetical protein
MNSNTYTEYWGRRQEKYSLICLQIEFQKDLQEMIDAPRKRGLDHKKKQKEMCHHTFGFCLRHHQA